MTEAVEHYYRLHSKIYDVTRWSFLFGRSRLVSELTEIAAPMRILEIGCGTGKNLAALARQFPGARITGVDLSAQMLRLAEKKSRAAEGRIDLVHMAYDHPLRSGQFDLAVCAYSLSMFNPGWRKAIECAYEDLCPGGIIAAVDFHNARFPWFSRWMRVNHVRMEGHLLDRLTHVFDPIHYRIAPAYLGIWEYFIFVGRRN